jgi:N-acetylneuraminic acid mutarotase
VSGPVGSANVDTNIRLDTSTSNLGTDPNVFVGVTNGATKVFRAIVAFNLSGIPAGATVTGCTLTVNVTQNTSPTAGHVRQLCGEHWLDGDAQSEMQATWLAWKTGTSWTTAGAGTAGVCGSGVDYTTANEIAYTPPGGTGSFTFPDLSALCQNAIAAQGGWLRLRISQDSESTQSNLFKFDSSDGSTAANRPKLTVTWSSAGGSTTTSTSTTSTSTSTTSSTSSSSSTSTTSTSSSTTSSTNVTTTTTPTTTTSTVPSGFDLLMSNAPDRSGAHPLAGSAIAGTLCAFVTPTAGVQQVLFYLDDPGLTGSPRLVETKAPFDFAGTAPDGTANPFDTLALADGAHTITAVVDTGTSSPAVSGTFFVGNGEPRLAFGTELVSVTLDSGVTSAQRTVALGSTDGLPAGYLLDIADPWLDVTPATGTTPATLTLDIDASGLPPGNYTTTVTAHALGYQSDILTVSLTVGPEGHCSPLPCEDLLVDLPYVLTFDQDHGFLHDRAGVGTGFTYVQPAPHGIGYAPGYLQMDLTAGVLNITTRAGLQFQTSNNQDNALGVGIDAPSQISVLTTTIVNPPVGTGNFEQAGLWFGVDQDNYVKLVVISTPQGTKIQHLLEVGGVQVAEKKTGVLNVANSRLQLILRVDPITRIVSSRYRIDNQGTHAVAGYATPPEFFSFDAAGIDPTIGTRSFGGIFASHRSAAASVVYSFDDFSVTAEALPASLDQPAFDRISATVPFPSSMVWGPDDRLYVTELFGTIHALSFAPDGTPAGDQVIPSLVNAQGPRLTLGITVDPASTPSDIALWVSHSTPSLSAGGLNSGRVTRLSGPGFGTVTNIITGLPRAIANHAVNSLHFGPDGKLYIAQAGNTGAGGANAAGTEFGDRPEQPLSAAILVADVFAPGFDGTCANTVDPQGPAPCDVKTYATGFRNPYDFVFHTNGSMYAPDNGLGVTGSYPNSPTPPCDGLADVTPYTLGGDNPGEQPDLLHRVIQGKYYGHPNPSRNECVFKDGSFQGVPPLPNWVPPLLDLGTNHSADGIIEYRGTHAFCGTLAGDLLISNYSVGDDLTRVELSDDGTTVVNASSLIGGFNDPLPIAQSPDGKIFVGEFGSNRVTELIPIDLGCWHRVANLPDALLDAGGAALDGLIYVVAGKTTVAHRSDMLAYDPVADTWTPRAPLPGPAVENPSVVAYGGKLYAFGGSTAPFSGAVANVAVYDPATNVWTPLAPMPTPRGGATASEVGGIIYVAGGLIDDGSSVATVEAYDPASDTWSIVAPLAVPRDNPGSTTLDGKIYVFGGRTRLADGTEVAPTLASVEAYDPATDTWTARAPMPTGRRTMFVGTLNGRAQLMGGERTPDGGTFPQNEEYDPTTNTWRQLTAMLTPRHGTAGGTIGNTIYVAGGGPSGGFSLTSVVEAFSF